MTIELISEDKIYRMEKAQDDAFGRMIDAQLDMKVEAWKQKEEFLSIYAKTLSPKIACKRTGVTPGQYKRWRSTCPQFCRGLNEVVLFARDELLGSALTRATGYTQPDSDSESGFKEDASGKVIRFGASDSLARSFLRLEEDDKKRSSSDVNVTINLGGFGFKTIKEAEATKIIDGKYVIDESVLEEDSDDNPPAA